MKDMLQTIEREQLGSRALAGVETLAVETSALLLGAGLTLLVTGVMLDDWSLVRTGAIFLTVSEMDVLISNTLSLYR